MLGFVSIDLMFEHHEWYQFLWGMLGYIALSRIGLCSGGDFYRPCELVVPKEEGTTIIKRC